MSRNEISGVVQGSAVQAETIAGDVHFHQRARPPGGWWIGASAAGVLVLVGVEELARLGWLPVAVGLLLAGSLAAWWMIRRAMTAGAGAYPLDSAISVLRQQVHRQWMEERNNRDLHEPRPLRLRWRPTARPVQAKLTDAESSRMELRRGALVQAADDPRPAATVLVEAFRQDSRRQLVVLGERGAGKSTLALLFTLASLDRPGDPVPVLLSVAGWDPEERIEDWITRRVGEDYPAVSRKQARQLLDDHLLLPVLDGLDEIPRGLLGRALRVLNRSAAAELRMVITCRSAEFEHAVAAGGALVHATVVEIEPIRPDDAREFFEQRDIEGARRWESVIDSMTEQPDGPLARLLSTPLMISLARRVYRRPDSRPEELAEFAATTEAEHHLLAEFLPAVYPDERYRAKAQRWLVFLAHHLDRQGDPNFEWWRLASAVPRWVIPTMIMIAPSASSLAFVMLTALSMGGSSYAPVLSVLLFSTCVMVGMHAGRAAHHPEAPAPQRPVPAVLNGVLRDIATAGTAFSVISSVFLLVAHATGSQIGKIAIREFIPKGDFGNVGFYEIIALAISIVINVLSVSRGGLPQRATPRPRTLVPNLAIGMGAGLIPGLAVGGLLGMFAQTQDEVFWRLSYVTACMSMVAIPLGMARWLVTPVRHETANSPGSVLRRDRTALLTAAVACGSIVVGLSMIFAWLTGDSILANWLLFLVIGYFVTILVLFGTGGAWMSYTVSRLWLAARGQLPCRLTTFLRNAHAAGILRQTGSAYQLRHDLVRAYLAEQHPDHHRAVRPAPGESPRRLKSAFRNGALWRLVLGLAVSIALLGGTIAYLFPVGNPRDVFHAGVGEVLSGSPLSRDGRVLVSYFWGDDGGRARVVNIRTRHSFDLGSSLRDVRGVAVSPDGGTAAVLWDGQSGSLELWDTNSGRVAATVPVKFSGYLSALVFSADGSAVIAIDGKEKAMRLFSVRTGEVIHTVKVEPPLIPWYLGSGDFVVDPESRNLFGVKVDGNLLEWDYGTGVATRISDDVCDRPFRCGVAIASGGKLQVADYSTGTIRYVGSGKTVHIADVVGLRHSLDTWKLSPDGRTLLTFDTDGNVRSWDVPAP
ncbi:NACHT and WD40 repeat domain-containing protein [Saccharopolyspora pogona]|uniref:NACHT and WD40 repeat domain-containing protein n=1 Tax=Saccharopolyspora pogona TaxID=333966 RepID=UPI00168806D6|nr:NACHT domain-containing protein [Saccharopolyspora pogona]